jgi:hypothetical protein
MVEISVKYYQRSPLDLVSRHSPPLLTPIYTTSNTQNKINMGKQQANATYMVEN